MISKYIMTDPKTMPTRGQLELLQFMHRLSQTLGRDPRQTDINEALGKSPAGVISVLRRLEAKGLIEFDESERRGAVKAVRGSFELTPRQTEARDAARELQRELGRAPGVADIATRLGLSRQGATALLIELEAKGAVTFEGRATRGPVRITKEGKQWL